VAFALTDEQQDLRRSTRGYLERRVPALAVRRDMESTSGFDARIWDELGDELGLRALLVPESLGGPGCGYVELALVLHEMGRALLPAPYFPTVALAGSAILLAGDDALAAELLPRLSAGPEAGTLALAPGPDGPVRAAPGDGGWTLTGASCFVPAGDVASVIVVRAEGDRGPGLFVVEGDGPRVEREPMAVLDATRRQARLRLSGAPARPLSAEGRGAELIDRVLDRARIALAAEQAGVAERCLETAVEYAKARVQFGRPIGSFQAIKHRCADVLLAVEGAKAAVRYAAWAADHAPARVPTAACVALAAALDASTAATAANIHVHGGIGFTWEHDAHLYYRRAHSARALLGDPSSQRRLLADRVAL
jgi:alkylation response protein AidB-like acyl-CoA dehydrogenase